ncbi:MAG TPA: hypothetical protein VGE02_13995 [Gemmatimonadales bacterium]
MYVGHLGIALGARGAAPQVPVWVLVLATQGCDWLELLLGTVLDGRDAVVWSHSIPAVAAAALALGVVVAMAFRSIGGGIAAAVAHASHWPLDFVGSLKPTWPGHPPAGLILYERPMLDFAAQATVIVLGWLLYQRCLRPERRFSSLSWLLVIALLLLQGLSDWVIHRGFLQGTSI